MTPASHYNTFSSTVPATGVSGRSPSIQAPLPSYPLPYDRRSPSAPVLKPSPSMLFPDSGSDCSGTPWSTAGSTAPTTPPRSTTGSSSLHPSWAPSGKTDARQISRKAESDDTTPAASSPSTTFVTELLTLAGEILDLVRGIQAHPQVDAAQVASSQNYGVDKNTNPSPNTLSPPSTDHNFETMRKDAILHVLIHAAAYFGRDQAIAELQKADTSLCCTRCNSDKASESNPVLSTPHKEPVPLPVVQGESTMEGNSATTGQSGSPIVPGSFPLSREASPAVTSDLGLSPSHTAAPEGGKVPTEVVTDRPNVDVEMTASHRLVEGKDLRPLPVIPHVSDLPAPRTVPTESSNSPRRTISSTSSRAPSPAPSSISDHGPLKLRGIPSLPPSPESSRRLRTESSANLSKQRSRSSVRRDPPARSTTPAPHAGVVSHRTGDSSVSYRATNAVAATHVVANPSHGTVYQTVQVATQQALPPYYPVQPMQPTHTPVFVQPAPQVYQGTQIQAQYYQPVYTSQGAYLLIKG